MKKCLSLLLTLILTVALSVSVGAVSLDEYKFNIEIDESYRVLTEKNIEKSEELVESLGHSIDSMKQYFKDNALIMFAVSEDGKRQLQVTCQETEFSQRMDDISLLGEDEALGFVSRFIKADNVSDIALITVGDMKLYEVASTNKDSGGSFCTVQYITVRGGKLYTIGFFEGSSAMSEEFKGFASDTIGTLSIGKNGGAGFSGTENIAEMIIVGLLIVLAAVVAIMVIVSLVRDAIRYDEDKKPLIIRRRRKK